MTYSVSENLENVIQLDNILSARTVNSPRFFLGLESRNKMFLIFICSIIMKKL